MMGWISDVVISLLPERVQWAITALLLILLIVVLTFLYFQGRLTW
jgi:uncharacterized membrane protein